MQDMQSELPQGIVPIVQTPYAQDGSIDVESLRRLVHDAIESGAAALISPAMASEVERLTEEERCAVIEIVSQTAAGRVPVIVGASSPSLEVCVRSAKYGRQCGCRMMLVQAPPLDDDGIEDFYRRLCSEVELELMIQDIDWVGSGMPMDLIARLFDSLPLFRFIKVETKNACPKYSEILERFDGRLHVSGGWAVMQLIDALDRGVNAFMPEASMVRIYEAVRRLHAQGERQAAWTLFERLLPVLAFSNQELDISIHFFKRLLVRRNIFTTSNVRPPTCVFDRFQEFLADELIDRVLEILAELSS